MKNTDKKGHTELFDFTSFEQEAIQTLFPGTDVQTCVVHQVRNSLNCVPYKGSQEFLRDMKAIYQSINLEQGEATLERLADK